MKGHQMLAKLRKDHENEEGFTLIELLVVVIIIGILAAIAIPAFLNQRQRGYQAALTSDVRNSALEVESEVTATGGGVLDATDGQAAVDGVRVSSDETTLTYSVISDGGTPATNTGFCVVGARPDLDDDVYYNSTAGGIMPFGAGNCTNGG